MIDVNARKKEEVFFTNTHKTGKSTQIGSFNSEGPVRPLKRPPAREPPPPSSPSFPYPTGPLSSLPTARVRGWRVNIGCARISMENELFRTRSP